MDSHHLHHLSARRRVHQKLESYPSENPKIKFLDKLLLVIAVIGPLVTIPQIIEIFETQDASNLSPLTWGMYCVFNILWFIYGIVHKEKPIMITYALWFLVNGIIFSSIFIFR